VVPKLQIEQSLERLERYNNPQRFSQLEQLHNKAFSWQEQSWIPLGIHVINQDYSKGLSYPDVWLKPEVFLTIQAANLADTLEVGSGLLPVIGINHLGDTVLTSFFGAKQRFPDSIDTNLKDVGPTPLPAYSDIEEIRNIEVISFDGGLMPEVERFTQFYRENLPDWINLVGPMPTGPFSAAMELRGSDILMDLIDYPWLCKKIISFCTDVCVEVEKRFRRIIKTPSHKHYTNFGILGAGLRIGPMLLCPGLRINPAWFCIRIPSLLKRVKEFGKYGRKPINDSWH